MPSRSAAEALNQDCFCRTLNEGRLREQIERDPCLQGLMQSITQTRPHLFSSTVVFLASEMAQKMAATIAAIERVIGLPGYQAQALARAPAIAQYAFGPIGACMGFDFHLGVQGPQLIEINTNAGGALLNVALARAQEACCEEMDWAFASKASADKLEQTFFDMFASEWQHQRGNAALGYVLIVDDDPLAPHLAPQFSFFPPIFIPPTPPPPPS